MLKKLLSLCLIVTFCSSATYSSTTVSNTILANDDELQKSIAYVFERDGEKITMNPWSNNDVSVDFKTATVYINGINNLKTFEDIDDMTQALILAGNETITFNMHSPGGSTTIMSLIIIQMEILKSKGIKIITKIDENNSCMSACTLIFLHGDERVAHRKSIFMFHSPYANGIQYEKRTAIRVLTEADIQAIRLQFKQDLISYCGAETPLINDIYDRGNHFYPSRVLQEICPNYITNLVGKKTLSDPAKGF